MIWKPSCSTQFDSRRETKIMMKVFLSRWAVCRPNPPKPFGIRMNSAYHRVLIVYALVDLHKNRIFLSLPFFSSLSHPRSFWPFLLIISPTNFGEGMVFYILWKIDNYLLVFRSVFFFVHSTYPQLKLYSSRHNGQEIKQIRNTQSR